MKPLEPITAVVNFKIRAGEEERFHEALLEHLPLSANEENCLAFHVLQHTEDPTRFLFYEEWTDRGDFVDVQMHREYRKAYMAATEHLWETARVIELWKRLPMPWDQAPASSQTDNGA